MLSIAEVVEVEVGKWKWNGSGSLASGSQRAPSLATAECIVPGHPPFLLSLFLPTTLPAFLSLQMNPTALPQARPAILLSKIVAAAGPQRLQAYIEQIFEPELVAIGYYTAENAENWLDIDKFMRWLGQHAQKTSVTPPSTPASSSVPPSQMQHPHLSSSRHLPPSSPIPATSSPVPPSFTRPHTSPPTAILDSEDDMSPTPLVQPRKRRRSQAEPKSHPAGSDSDGVIVPTKKAKRRTNRGGSGGTKVHEITKQFHVSEIRDIDEIPSVWTVPRPDDGEDFVYRLDITHRSQDWLNDKKEPLSMAAIIKSEDQDSWGGGSAGATNKAKATKVAALDGVLCQVAKHECQGVYVCSELDISLLENHERYEPDDEEMRELFEAERVVNVRETSSVAIRAAAFYKEIHTRLCTFRDANGVLCNGDPVYRKLKEMNFDGKFGFIGCQNYRAGDPRGHRFITIQRDVQEDLLRELLANNGVFQSDMNIDSETAVSYTHIDAKQQVIQGTIIHRKCNTIIRIFSPLDRLDRRAIVHLSGAHNHPKFPSRKVSRKGKEAYRDAIAAAGVMGLTVLKCDSAPTTSKVFGGKIPGAYDPALSNTRIKRKLIQEMKTADNPHGLGIEGVLYYQKQMCSLPHGKQYIWKVASEFGEEIIITMLPYLANRIHLAKASLHDNTYARVHGVWKEWEVVIWDHRVDHRVSIGRIYSQHETLAVFMKMWPGLFDTIAHITESEVKINFIDGEGLKAILVDGNKPQANALGAWLVNRNKPHLSGVHERNPKLILPKVLRTCIFHVNRKFSEMATVVPDEPMGRIRRSPYLKTQEELDDFVQWAKTCEYKVVRDWIKDKDSIPWFFPSINEFLSDIPKDDWYLTPGDTNLNESAHPFTNQHTGTNLSILEAIQAAYKLDLEVEARLRAIEENCVLVNHLNTKPHRDRRNDSRRTSHFNQALERRDARNELEGLDDAIQSSTVLTRELREKKKLLKSTSGVKKTKRMGEKQKDKLPDDNEFAGISDSEGGPDLSQFSHNHGPALYFTEHPDASSSHEVQLEPSLEPLFPPRLVDNSAEFFPLFGDISNYLPY
ncbi:hypothetical protein C8R44DRAFT_726114 [Mycena epipterygia]|nr:hypothetical protein C8R44DRAFT_726114 [Mycena epipterygia]